MIWIDADTDTATATAHGVMMLCWMSSDELQMKSCVDSKISSFHVWLRSYWNACDDRFFPLAANPNEWKRKQWKDEQCQ